MKLNLDECEPGYEMIRRKGGQVQLQSEALFLLSSTGHKSGSSFLLQQEGCGSTDRQTDSAGARFTAVLLHRVSCAICICSSAGSICQKGIKSCTHTFSLPRCIFQFITNPYYFRGIYGITDGITYTCLKRVKPADISKRDFYSTQPQHHHKVIRQRESSLCILSHPGYNLVCPRRCPSNPVALNIAVLFLRSYVLYKYC